MSVIRNDRINDIAVLMVQTSDTLIILDHSKVGSTSYTGYQGGALGGLIEALIVGAFTSGNIQDSLGGDPETLRKLLHDLPVKDLLFEDIKKQLSSKYTVTNIEQLVESGTIDFSINDFSPDEHLHVLNRLGFDSFIKVNFVYGLAGYATEPASAVLDVGIHVWDTSDSEALMNTAVHSDLIYRQGHTIDEFTMNNAELFKHDIKEASKAVALQIGAIFDIDADKAKKQEAYGNVSYFGASCNKPYKLTQDCSNFTGAKRAIAIDDNSFYIAGSEDGTSLLFTDDTSEVTDTLKAVKAFFSHHNIRIIKQITMSGLTGVKGYFLELDGDGYSVLKGLSEPR